MRNSFIGCSPAKINLFLSLKGKRDDGYHELETLLQAISLFDKITVKFAQIDQCFIDHPLVPSDHRNLAVKAVEVFREAYSPAKEQKFHLTINKQIPVGAGLGGGSSNAATVLFGLNQLFGSPFSEHDLRELGAQLGSDVPFFFSSGTALCTGRGECVTSKEPSSLGPISLVCPEIFVSTKEVYNKVQLLDNLGQSSEMFMNELEPAAFLWQPELRKLKQDLLEVGFHHVVLSGSGSAFFCLGRAELKPCAGLQIYEVSPIQRANTTSWYQELS